MQALHRVALLHAWPVASQRGAFFGQAVRHAGCAACTALIAAVQRAGRAAGQGRARGRRPAPDAARGQAQRAQQRHEQHDQLLAGARARLGRAAQPRHRARQATRRRQVALRARRARRGAGPAAAGPSRLSPGCLTPMLTAAWDGRCCFFSFETKIPPGAHADGTNPASSATQRQRGCLHPRAPASLAPSQAC